MAPTTTAADPTKAVLAAYQRYWQLWIEDNDPPNPDDPRLAEVESGRQLTGTRDAIGRNRANGIVIRLPSHSVSRDDATVQFTSPVSAVVIDCSVDDSMEVSAGSGRVIDGSVVTQVIYATVSLEDGSWKITLTTFGKKWSGVTSCDG